MVRTVRVTAEVPEALARSLKIEQAALGKELRIAAGLAWFRQRRLSKEDAANVAELSPSEFARLNEGDFLLASWYEIRPYAQKMMVDFAITILLWLMLFTFEKLRDALPNKGWVGGIFPYIHDAGTAVILCLSTLIFAIDIFRILKSKLGGPNHD